MLLHISRILWLKVRNLASGQFEKNKTAVECLQTSHLSMFISWGDLIVKLFIKNVLLLKDKKNSVNSASTTNQINTN